MKTKLKIILACLAIGFTVAAHAGDKAGNGGDSAPNSGGGRSLLDLVESDELRYFEFKMSDYDYGLADDYNWEILGSSMNFLGLYLKLDKSFNRAVSACNGNIYERIDLGEGSAPRYSAANEFYPNLKALRWAFVDSDLENIRDEGVIRISNPGSAKQLAVQSDGLVVINRSEFNRLDGLSKAALKLHELTICAVKTMNPALLQQQGTAPIRNFVRQFVNFGTSRRDLMAKEKVPVFVVQEALQSLNLAAPPEAQKVGEFSNPNDKDGSNTCTAKIWSMPGEEPNVLLECLRYLKNDDKDNVRMRIRINAPNAVVSLGGYANIWISATYEARGTEIFATKPVTDAGPVGRSYISVAQAWVRSHPTLLLNAWNVYVSSADPRLKK